VGKAESIRLIDDYMTKAAGEGQESARDESIRTVLAEWNKVCAGIELFNSEFSNLGKGEEKSRESISATVMKIHEAIRDTDARAYLRAVRIGTDNTDASGEGAESVWDTLRRLCTTLSEVQHIVNDGTKEMKQVKEEGSEMKGKMANFSQNLIGLKQHVVDSLNVIHRKILSLETTGRVGSDGRDSQDGSELSRFRVRLEELEKMARYHARRNTGEEVERLAVDMAVIQRRMDHRDHEAQPTREGVGLLQSSEARIQDCLRKVKRTVQILEAISGPEDDRIQEQLDQLSTRVDTTEVRGLDEAFELDQFSFGSFAEFGKMALDEKIPTAGMFWDLFSVLVSMRPKGLSGKERADEQYSSERIRTTIFENNLLASMNHTCPACLYAKGGVGLLIGLDEGFGACESYAQWIAGVESMKKVLGKQLKDFTSGVLGKMRTGGGGNSLAKAFLSEVRA
jgi:hypothetical protein